MSNKPGQPRKYGNLDLVTFSEAERLLEVDRRKRLELIKSYALRVVDLLGGKRLVKTDIIKMLDKCVEISTRTAGKPRGWGRLEFVSLKTLRSKWGISPAKLKELQRRFNVRVVNLDGSRRVPMHDLELLLNKQVKTPETTK